MSGVEESCGDVYGHEARHQGDPSISGEVGPRHQLEWPRRGALRGQQQRHDRDGGGARGG
jgi:hypothetical protein